MKSFKSYIRAVVLSSVIVFNIIFSFWGVCRAYEGIRMIGYGENKSAIELIYGADNALEKIRILDFEFIC